jgi:hypothetical protein
MQEFYMVLETLFKSNLITLSSYNALVTAYEHDMKEVAHSK